ncbi:hypothetical protein AX15_005806 [Amanita polypyramis BW_CC]|nr:hypothetical protein AX15_005806 [Amanita polypyramis BW_CC]
MPSLRIPTIVYSFVQALVFGAYVTTFIHCLRWLLHGGKGWSRREGGNVSILIVSIGIFLLQTVGLATSFKATLEIQSLGSTGYNLYNTITNAVQYTTFEVVDAVLIYRCWVVYNNSWKIICLPVFLWISSVVISSYDIYIYVRILGTTDPGTIDKLTSLALPIWDGFFACNIAINIYATSMYILFFKFELTQPHKSCHCLSNRICRKEEH